ncbi:protein UL38 [Panine betaherpesvirus 2]|uniref:Protein UL38 n=1 Tax=Panine betaherpesvirus 2 TaxID=188763 RepID=Q8QS50_9BETA|nr:protein UL38 [Panine betaherpesvirus 2]AAM00688.1 protein UL38 [Panine betaherpesvirus 2]QXV67792.1 protein UL38 [Panine betaherpesvirus 2]
MAAVATTHATTAIMSMLDEAERQQAQVDVGSLIQASTLGKVALRCLVKKFMKRGVRLPHDSGLYVCICDPTYEFLTMNLAKINWLERHCPPLDQELVMFGVIESWEEAAPRPTRQVVLFMTPKWDVFAYESGLLFYLAPSMSQFWHGVIVFEYWNALFPVEVRNHIRQYAQSMDDLLMIYHQLDYEKQVLEARRDKNAVGPRTFAKSVNCYVRAILEAERRIREGKMPVAFVDRDSLRANSLIVTDQPQQQPRQSQQSPQQRRRGHHAHFVDIAPRPTVHRVLSAPPNMLSSANGVTVLPPTTPCEMDESSCSSTSSSTCTASPSPPLIVGAEETVYTSDDIQMVVV